MRTLPGIELSSVQQVYGGPEGDLWELIMGQQIHVGGFASSMDLAEKAGLAAGLRGVDLCCCNGAGLRFLRTRAASTSLSARFQAQRRSIPKPTSNTVRIATTSRR